MLAEVVEVEQNLVEAGQIQVVAQADRAVHHAKPFLRTAKMHPRPLRFEQAFDAFDLLASDSHQPVFLVLILSQEAVPELAATGTEKKFACHLTCH